MTTREALAEFIDCLTARCDRPVTCASPTPAAARRSYEAAERELDAIMGPRK
jgi:hypothetical protein